MNNMLLKPGVVLALLLFLPFLQLNTSKPKSSNPSVFLGDSQHTGYYSSASVKNAPRLLWKFDTGGPVISSPILSEGTLYIGSNNNSMYALDADSGGQMAVRN